MVLGCTIESGGAHLKVDKVMFRYVYEYNDKSEFMELDLLTAHSFDFDMEVSYIETEDTDGALIFRNSLYDEITGANQLKSLKKTLEQDLKNAAKEVQDAKRVKIEEKLIETFMKISEIENQTSIDVSEAKNAVLNMIR